MKSVFKPFTKPFKDVAEDVAMCMMETCKENNKALESIIKKYSEIMNDRGILASCLLFFYLKERNLNILIILN